MTRNKVLFLNLHTFSLMGGIEKVNRSLTKALSELASSQEITNCEIFSMYDDSPDLAYTKKSSFSGFNGSRISFGIATLISGITSDVVILSHINLLIFGRMIKKVKPKTRIILLAHGIEVWAELQRWKTTFLMSCEIWAVSNFTAEKLNVTHKIPLSKIQVLNNCIDPHFNIPTQFDKPESTLVRYKLTSNQPVLFTLTRLSSAEQYKGYDLILDCIKDLSKTHPNIRYMLSGKSDPIENQRIKEIIKINKIEEFVILTGFLPDNEVQDHYLLADAFVMPSKAEGFGISFIEAAACGCPSIAGNKDGSTDALVNGKLGRLIDPNKKSALIAAILETLKTGRSVENSTRLQKECLENFSYESYKEKVLTLLKNKTYAT